MLKDFSLTSLTAGFVAVLVGFTSSAVIADFPGYGVRRIAVRHRGGFLGSDCRGAGDAGIAARISLAAGNGMLRLVYQSGTHIYERGIQ